MTPALVDRRWSREPILVDKSDKSVPVVMCCALLGQYFPAEKRPRASNQRLATEKD